jgi:hypothetical protein
MVENDAVDLMKSYAIHGINDWSRVTDAVKSRARKLLEYRLAENEAQAMNAIAYAYGAKKPEMFIPMPMVHHKGIEHCFFLPSRDVNNRTSFQLLLLCEGRNCLGFRFDPPQTGTHMYSHIQMNRKMGKKDIEVVGLPNWVPTRYPAFPLCSSDPLRMFLSMTTSVHGFRKGMGEVLQTAFAREPAQMKKYLDLLARHLAA